MNPLIYIYNWIACGVCSIIVQRPHAQCNSFVSFLQRGRGTSRLRGNAMKQCACACVIDPIHVTAMMNKKRGLEGKFARQYVNRDVTSLLLHVPVT